MTALPDGVTYKKEGTLRFVSERGYWTPPPTSCMFAALDAILEWMGLATPLPRLESAIPPDNFVHALHVASGASLKSGTNVRDTQVALQKLLPDVPVKFGSGTPDEIIDLVNNGAAVRVVVRHCNELPTYLRRFVGKNYKGGHALSVMGARTTNGVQEVLWFDPMARPVATWQGEWVRWEDVLPAITGPGGNIAVTFGYKSEAIPVPVEPPINEGGDGDTQMIFSNVVEGSRGTVEASTQVLHPETLVAILTVAAGTVVKLVGITPDGKYRGVLVNSAKIDGVNPKIALIAAEAVTDLTVDDPCKDVKAQLEAALKNSAQDVADAQSIVGRHG